jgi:hypothetical protein
VAARKDVQTAPVRTRSTGAIAFWAALGLLGFLLLYYRGQ